MTVNRFSTATLALLLASGMAYAQDSTTTVPKSPAGIDCPAVGTVPADQIPAECKNDSTAAPGSTAPDSTAAAPDAAPAPEVVPPDATATTNAEDDMTKTGAAEQPKAGTDMSTTAANPDVNAAPGAAMAEAGSPTSVLASQFMGQSVFSPANENVGEINDLVMDKKLDTIVAIIGVGGFLGMGEKDVAIPIEEIVANKDANNNLTLTIQKTKEQLEAAPAFDTTALTATQPAAQP
jgi:sporulation protein YlmC with PRC-barrel domain